MGGAVILLEVPEPSAERIRAFQARRGYVPSARLPVHITLAGSSGVGNLVLTGNGEAEFTVIKRIAAATPPIAASFGPPVRFADSDTFVLKLTDERRVVTLHRKLVHSGLRFQSSPYPFQPHCTISSRQALAPDDAVELLAFRLADPFALSVLTRVSTRTARRVALSGSAGE